jgi:hypothetical protein
MPRIMPTSRSYGAIGPNQFALYLEKTGTDIEGLICGKMQDHGVFNGKEWPFSMTKCHEGHIAALLHAVKFRLSLNDLETAVVWIKIIQGERQYLPAMNFAETMSEVFAETEGIAAQFVSKWGTGLFDSVDPGEWFDAKFGSISDPTVLRAAPLQADPPNLLTFNPGRMGDAVIAGVGSMIKRGLLGALIGLVLAVVFNRSWFWLALIIGSVSGFVTAFRAVYESAGSSR